MQSWKVLLKLIDALVQIWPNFQMEAQKQIKMINPDFWKSLWLHKFTWPPSPTEPVLEMLARIKLFRKIEFLLGNHICVEKWDSTMSQFDPTLHYYYWLNICTIIDCSRHISSLFPSLCSIIDIINVMGIETYWMKLLQNTLPAELDSKFCSEYFVSGSIKKIFVLTWQVETSYQAWETQF